MTIVGFNFTRIDAVKKAPIKGKINISNNVAIKDVEKADLSLGSTEQDGLRFIFQFTSSYEPDIGSIELGGDVLYMEDAKKVKEILSGWKKEKKIPKEIMKNVLNTVLSKSNIEALIISKEVNLPPPIPMPKINIEEKKEE